MDIKHRKAYARIKQTGNAEAVTINDGLSIVQLMMRIASSLQSLPPRYNRLDITIDFKPLTEHETDQERGYREVLEGLDLSDIEIESPESEASERAWARSPLNPESDSYDPLYFEYIRCAGSLHRASKTPADLAQLRNHVESKYSGTEWWDGAHRW